MPFIVKHQDAGDILTLASAAGYQQGRAQHWARQQQLDARVSEMAIAASQRRNAEPGFFERMSGGTFGLGAGVRPPGLAQPSSPGAPAGDVQTFDRFGRVGDPFADEARTIAALTERAAAEQKRDAEARKAERQGAGGAPTLPEGPSATPETRQPAITGEEGMAGERRGARMLEQGRTDEFVDLATRRAGAPRRGPSGELIPAERTKDAVDAMSAFYAQMPTIPVPDLRVYREKFAAEGMTQAVQDIDKEIEERKIANMIGQVPQTTQSVLNTWKRGVETLRQEMGRDPTPEELVLGLELSIEQITQGDPEQEATLMELMMSDHPVLIQYRQHLVDPQVPNPFDAQPQQPQRQPQGGVSGAHLEPTLQPGNTVTVNRQQGGS